MKKLLGIMLSVSLLSSAIPVVTAEETGEKATETVSYTYSAGEGKTYTREMEKLGRGLVAVKSSSGVYLSWRLLDSEDARFGSADKNVSFNVYRGDEKIAEVGDTTNYTDSTAGTSYSVAPVVNGREGEKCEAVSVMDNSYFDIQLVKPEPETIYDNSGNVVYESIPFSPADCSTGDLDGDGEYEIIVKWTSSEHDVGSPGDPSYSGTVRFAAYKLDGTKLWDNDINLGKNVYSSAHTAQFLVYDFDGDGKAEMAVQTSLGSKDAKGNYVSHSAKSDATVASTGAKIAEFTDEQNEEADYRNAGWGLITTGEEFLTIFNGETGAAIDTIDLPTARGNVMDWGDANNTAGNRVNRFIADVAYLDGEKPYAVYLRGYYFGKDNNGRQRTSIAGISFDGERLSPDYRFDTKSGQPGYYEGAYQYVGQGNHNCTVADVDNDGKDEFITGALCMEVDDNNDFKPRWCTYLQHGDALHIGDYDPTHKGFEFFTVHEDNGVNSLSGKNITLDFGMSVIDADTGEFLFHEAGSDDTGRGVMANIGMGGFYQIWSSKNELYMSNGETNYSGGSKAGLSQNFRVFWDGDLYDELLDGTNITSWNGNGMSRIFSASGCTKINGTKSNPALQADLFGDWREEVVYPTSDGTKLRVFTTTTETKYKIKTLMHDPVYRSGVAAEQTAYNQPPHVGMYLAEEMFAAEVESIEITSMPSKTSYITGDELDRTGLAVTAHYDDGTFSAVNAYTVSGFDTNTPGEQTITVTYRGKTASFKVTVQSVTDIEIVQPPKNTIVYQGGSLDTTGLVVKANYSDGTSGEISDYTISEVDSSKTGTQTITVTYKDKTATFDITLKPVESIKIIKHPTAIYVGGSFTKSELVVEAVYDDGNTLEITNYSLSAYDNKTPGTKTITVSYKGKTTTFNLEVKSADIGALNKTYETDSTNSVLTTLPIGSYSGDFTIEHTLTINSLPAPGTLDKNNTSGFFMRFMSSSGAGNHTGAGFTFTNYSDSQVRITWKTSQSRRITEIEVGKTYRFKYNFTNVGAGTGAALELTITDENGNQIFSESGLNLRNFSDTSTGKLAPITYVEVYNQAKSGSTASVTLDNAIVYSAGEIVSVSGKDITLNLSNAYGMRVYAAKYSEGALADVEALTPSAAGKSTLTASFEPDKVFLWGGLMLPIDMWEKAAE